MNIRPAHLWWIGVFLFGLSLILWIAAFWIAEGFHAPLDTFGLKYVHIPFIAAIVAFLFPLFALWRL